MPVSRQFCTFYVNQQCYGIDVMHVQEIVRSQPLTRVPLADRTVRGLMNLRGQIVTAIDMRRRLDLPERSEPSEPVNVVLQTGSGAVALLVDEIGDVLEVDEQQFERAPETLRGPSRDLIQGAYKLPGKLLVVLNPQHVVSPPDHAARIK
jgi:purine-binding chemotaxis protein CheW